MSVRQASKSPRAAANSENLRTLLAALHHVYMTNSAMTLPQLLIAIEVLCAEVEGEPHTLVSLVKKLDMPFSTASRIVWSLTAESDADIGVVKYVPHPTDRRKKLLVSSSTRLLNSVSKAMDRALS